MNPKGGVQGLGVEGRKWSSLVRLDVSNAWGGEREREREKERERERERDRERDRQRESETQTDRERERERESEGPNPNAYKPLNPQALRSPIGTIVGALQKVYIPYRSLIYPKLPT